MMRARLEGDAGSGSVLAVAVIGALVAIVAMGLPIYLGLAVKQSVRGAADAAALAAADVAIGILPGFPCEAAGRVARANGASLLSCELDGLIATVSVSVSILGIPAVTAATAGPPVGD